MSDDEDFFSLSPLQRSSSQIAHSQLYKKEKPSRLSLSQRNSKFKVPLAKHGKISKVKIEPKFNVPSKFFSCSTPINQKKKSVEMFFKEEGSSPTLEQNLNTEVCSICMMPWSTYEANGKSREFHTDECIEVDLSVKPECEAGVECSEVHDNHFWKFSHKVLAEIRADHERAVSQRLSQSAEDQEDQKDLKTIWNTETLSNDLECGDLAVAGPSRREGSVVTPNQGKMNSCTFNSEMDINEDCVSSKTSKHIQLFNSDLDDCRSETDTVYFEYNTPLLEKHNPVMGRLKNLRRTKQLRKELSFDILENTEVPDLDLSSVTQINHDGFEDDEHTLIHGKTMHSQVTSPVLLRDETFDESTVIFNENSANKDFMGDFSACYPKERESTSDSTQSVSLLQNGTVSAGDKEIHIEQQLNKTPNIDHVMRTTGVETSENCNGDSNTCSDVSKPSWSEEKCQENNGVIEHLVELAVEKYFDIAQRKDSEKPVASTSQNEQDSKNEKLCQGGPSCRPCIHIHFHLEELAESPRKGGQTSILDFFQSTKAGKVPDSPKAKKCTSCCSCGEGESKPTKGKSQAENWKEFMSLMQKKKVSLPSVTKSSISSGGSKEDTFSAPQQDQDKENGWQQRRCPFYKYIPDTAIVVDAFSYGYLEGVRAYFLTHFHYDHYRGLKKSFNHPIYCSEITAKLVNLRIGVHNQYLHPLPMEESRVVCDVEVTLLDANHCPGSVMFLFRLRTGSTILHVGDFRAHPKMESYPALWNSSIDALYLDTTYCNPLYDFPSQEDVLEKCVAVATDHVRNNPRTLIVVGSYSIGKERVFKAIASSLNCRVWASKDKQKTLLCIQDEEVQAQLTSDKFSARVHVVSMADLKPQKLMRYVETLRPHYTVVVAIRPTGWEHSGDCDDMLNKLSPKQIGNVYIYGIPYSEHSSYPELKRFVQFIQPKKVIPTVNAGNPNNRKRMEQDFADWLKKPNDGNVRQLFKK